MNVLSFWSVTIPTQCSSLDLENISQGKHKEYFFFPTIFLLLPSPFVHTGEG